MWSDGIVLSPPRFDQDFHLSETLEYLAIEQFVAKRPVEAVIVPILPWRSWRDVERIYADLLQPLLDGCRDELTAIVGPDIGRRATRATLRCVDRC